MDGDGGDYGVVSRLSGFRVLDDRNFSWTYRVPDESWTGARNLQIVLEATQPTGESNINNKNFTTFFEKVVANICSSREFDGDVAMPADWWSQLWPDLLRQVKIYRNGSLLAVFRATRFSGLLGENHVSFLIVDGEAGHRWSHGMNEFVWGAAPGNNTDGDIDDPQGGGPPPAVGPPAGGGGGDTGSNYAGAATRDMTRRQTPAMRGGDF